MAGYVLSTFSLLFCPFRVGLWLGQILTEKMTTDCPGGQVGKSDFPHSSRAWALKC